MTKRRSRCIASASFFATVCFALPRPTEEVVGEQEKTINIVFSKRRSQSKEPKERVYRATRGDYATRVGLSNPTSATILCIQFGCQPQKPRCRKASGLFYTPFSQCNFGRCQWMKSTCGWDLNLNNRLFRGVCETKKSHKLPFFRHFQKIFVNNLCLKRRIRI